MLVILVHSLRVNIELISDICMYSWSILLSQLSATAPLFNSCSSSSCSASLQWAGIHVYVMKASEEKMSKQRVAEPTKQLLFSVIRNVMAFYEVHHNITYNQNILYCTPRPVRHLAPISGDTARSPPQKSYKYIVCISASFHAREFVPNVDCFFREWYSNSVYTRTYTHRHILIGYSWICFRMFGLYFCALTFNEAASFIWLPSTGSSGNAGARAKLRLFKHIEHQ